ncbi:hypothetical protein F4809DRAFT_126734 [Biscogniauxia mediterranea]|nr:hypothetical protein F4809DRAFT_126734 [Biscogniauxia mediterranea]
MASHGVAQYNRAARTAEQRQQDLDKIDKYRQIEDDIRSRVRQGAHDTTLFQLTSKLLRLNPEYHTIWNVRRRCLVSSLLSKPSSASSPVALPQGDQSGATADADADADADMLQSELAFTVPLLMEFPKCYWLWGYRKWILEQAILRLSTPVATAIWEGELALDSKMLTKDRRNFHAWGYRRYLVARLETPELRGKSMVEDEFAYTTKMIRVDLSNFSAWHNRSRLIGRLLDERGADDKARSAFLEAELDQIREALNVGPEDQSLWYYHRYLILQLVYRSKESTIVPGLTIEERIPYIEREIEDIKDLLEDYDDIKWIYEALLEYTLALGQLRQASQSTIGGGKQQDDGLQTWLSKLRKLDPMQAGRWNDVERELKSRRETT